MAQQSDVTVIPTITASSAYASGNQIGGLLTIPGVNAGGSEGTRLEKIVVVDKAGQSAAVDVLVFNAAPSVGSDKAAVAISAADLATKCIGNAKILSADYSSAGTPSVATYTRPSGPLFAKPVQGGAATLYAVLVSRGTPTFTSTSDIIVKFQFSWD